MLSIENPPPDPSSCPCEISQLKSSDEIDTYPQLDLLKSGPKFSIRDYVSSTRKKDIKTNWPFSRENLQLCLEHGVNDLLPPFQSLDTVRKPSAKRCAVENAEELNEESSRLKNHLVSVTSSDAKPVSDSVNINPSGSAEDRDIPSTSSSETNSKKSGSAEEDRDIPSTSSFELEAHTSRKPEKKVPAASKVEIVKPPVKKCRLVLKLSSTSDQGSKEDNRSNNLLSETMASKVCPVCKTFASSSNTTLNAHIDQCLSGESTIKWTANPKVIKNKIKPKRMKSMVDIYATAVHYTLEDLDRRNGTNWAAGSSLPAQETEVDTAERKQNSPVSFEESENEGAVYLDANGTKLRILSKFNDLSSPAKVGECFGSRRLVKGDKGSKFLLSKKKKKKHHKLHKIAPHSKKFCSTKHHHTSEINDGQEQNVASEEVGEEVEAFTQNSKAHDPVKFIESGTMGGWVRSKQSDLMKKMNDKDDHQHSAYTKKKELGGEDKELSLGNSHVKRGYVFRSPNCSKNPCSSPKTNINSSSEPHNEYKELLMRKRASVSSSSSKTNISSSSEPHDENENEHYVRKRARVSTMEPRACHDQNSSLVLSEANRKQLRKNGSSADGNNKGHAHDKTYHGSSQSEIKRASTTKTKKFSLKTNKLSVLESKSSLKRKLLTLKKPRPRHALESDEEAMVLQNEVNEKNDSIEYLRKVKTPIEKGKPRDNGSVDSTRVLKVIKKHKGKSKILRKEEGVILKGLKSALEYHEHDDDDRFESLVGNILTRAVNGEGSPVKEVQLSGDDIFVKPASGFPAEEASEGISKSSGVRCASRQFVEIYDGPFLGTEGSRCPVEPILSSGQDIYCTNEDDENINDADVHMRTELESDDGPGNYYTEVDPIPIPGPPGSFLPSPGRMTSEEFQGNSSLSSCQIQSSEDHPELADRDSSDSPSATSTISNSDVTKFDSRFFEKLNLVPHHVHGEIRSSVSGVSLGVDNLTPDPCAAYAGAERSNPIEPKATMIFPETGLFRFKNDQPCCCSRKEGAVLGAVGLNLHESSHLRRQTISSDQQSLSDKQINGGDASRKLDNYNLMSEVLSSGDRSRGTENTSGCAPLQIPNQASAICEGKFVTNCNGNPASPSVSTPVLRLMGKDLMVVNKDENMSPQLRPSQSPVMKGHGNRQSYTASGGAFSCNILKEEAVSSDHMVSQGPIFSQTRGSNTVTAQHFDVVLSNGYNNGTFGSQRSTHASSLVLSGRSVHESSQSVEYMHGCYFPPEQLRAMNRFSNPRACDFEKAVTTKEMTFIDDAPESATDAILGVGMMRGSDSSASKSVSVTSGFDPRRADPFYGYQSHTSSPRGGSPLPQSATFHQIPPAVGVNSSNINWNCVPKVSNLLPKSDFPSSSSPANHMRSTLYHSHGFS